MVQEINRGIIVRDVMGYTVLQAGLDENSKLVTEFEDLKPGVYVLVISINNAEKIIRIEKK